MLRRKRYAQLRSISMASTLTSVSALTRPKKLLNVTKRTSSVSWSDQKEKRQRSAAANRQNNAVPRSFYAHRTRLVLSRASAAQPKMRLQRSRRTGQVSKKVNRVPSILQMLPSECKVKVIRLYQRSL